MKALCTLGSSINDVTALRRGCQWLCDVIYGRSLTSLRLSSEFSCSMPYNFFLRRSVSARHFPASDLHSFNFTSPSYRTKYTQYEIRETTLCNHEVNKHKVGYKLRNDARGSKLFLGDKGRNITQPTMMWQINFRYSIGFSNFFNFSI